MKTMKEKLYETQNINLLTINFNIYFNEMINGR